MSRVKDTKSSWKPFKVWKAELQRKGQWVERSGSSKAGTPTKGGSRSKNGSVTPPVSDVVVCPHCGGLHRLGGH